VREVEKTLVLEIAFDSIHVSTRHKSGLAMRFPRIARIRTDKPAAEADTIEALKRLAT
jgi:DNA ligase-1